MSAMQGARPPGAKDLDFPQNRCILWDKTATSKPTFLHLGYYRKPKVYIPEKILKLVQHQCEIYDLKCHTLIGSLVVEDDGEGIQFQVDRLDTRPIVSPDLSANLAPGDLLIPFEVSNNAAKDRHGSVDTFSAALERLQVHCSSKNSIDMSNFVLLRAWGSFYSNSTSSVIHMDFDMVTMGTIFKATPINPVPIALTALSKNLAGPMSLSNTQGMPKSGYLTMDHTRKLLLVLESDPKCVTLPIVGIWVSGADFVQHPFVWAACLRYIHNTHLQDRVCFPPEDFLLVLYSKLHSRPEFFQCCTTTKETKLLYELRSGHEVGNLTKALSNPSEDLFEIELSPPEYGEKKSLFEAAVDRFSPLLLNSESESHVEEWTGTSDDIQPRSAPTPYTDKIPVFQPMVPDVSILWSDVSNQSETATGASHPGLQHPQPHVMGSSDVSATNEYSRITLAQPCIPSAELRHEFHRIPNAFPNRPPFSHSGVAPSQYQSPGYRPQLSQREIAFDHMAAISQRHNTPFPPTSSSRNCASYQVPSANHSCPGNGGTFTFSQGACPSKQAIQLDTRIPQPFLTSRYTSTHNCTMAQAPQPLVNTVSVSTHQNSYFPETSHPDLKVQTNASDKAMIRNGAPSLFVNSPRHINEIVSSCSPQTQIKKNLVQVSSSPSMRGNFYPFSDSHSCTSRAVPLVSNPVQFIQNSSAMPYPPINQHMAQQPMSCMNFPSGQHTSARTSQQAVFTTAPQVPHLRHSQAPVNLLNTVIEESSSSTTSSSERSCQCHPAENSLSHRREENASGANNSDNTQNSTKSSDDDSGLSVTPERPTPSPHPSHNPLQLNGPLEEAQVDQQASSALRTGIDNVDWSNVPPEIRALILHQNEQLKQLQKQIQFLMMKDSQPTNVMEKVPVTHSQTLEAAAPDQREKMCSVAVNTTLIRDQSDDCHSKSVQTSPVKSCRSQAHSPVSSSRERHLEKDHTESNSCETPSRNNVPSPQAASLPALEPCLQQGLNLAESKVLDDSSHGFSDPRLEMEHSASEGNYFMDGQNDSFSTMADDASDPRQYYNQLMNNIQMFLLNGENENDDNSGTADQAILVPNETQSALDLPENGDETLSQHINYMSMMLGLGSETGQSMEINAMAMKYLKDEQLTQVARMRQKGGSNSRILQKVIGDLKLSTPEVSHFGISPNDLTMGTKKYLEKHGLLGDNSSEVQEFSPFDHTMKLKTDFSMASFGQSSVRNDNNYQPGQLTRPSGNTPVRKEFVKMQNYQTPDSPEDVTPKSIRIGTETSEAKGIRKCEDIGASPVLTAPKHYDMTEVLPYPHSSKPITEQRKLQSRRCLGKGHAYDMQKGHDFEAKSNTTEQEEENILDIAKLKQLPKLL